MEIVVVSLLPAVLVAACLGRQLLLYPVRRGDWHHAFGRDHADGRRELHEARLRRRAVEAESRRRIAEADRRVAEVVRQGRQQTQALARERRELLSDGPGEQRGMLGDLVLYEHALHFLPAARDGEKAPAEPRRKLPLQGLEVKADLTRTPSSLRLTWPKGTERVAYPRHDTREVESFARQIHTEVQRDARHRTGRERRAAEISARIEEIQAKTAEHRAERERERRRLTVSLGTDRRQAEKEWAAACAVWQVRTGRRPRWAWRW